MTHLLLYTNEPILALGLEAVAAAPEFAVASVNCSMESLAGEVSARNPDILLVDLMSDLPFGAVIELQRQAPATRIVLWTRSISTEVAYQAIEHGVRGILLRTHPPEIALKCFRLVAEDGLWFEETLKSSFTGIRAVSLTRREGQLVTLLAQGLKNKEIASTLFISEGTVKVYLSRLFDKLRVNDRFELALFGLKNMQMGGRFLAVPRSQPEFPLQEEARQPQWLRSLVMELPLAKAGAEGGSGCS
jgi:DNA-binding NarL/FixJ family response regulator